MGANKQHHYQNIHPWKTAHPIWPYPIWVYSTLEYTQIWVYPNLDYIQTLATAIEIAISRTNENQLLINKNLRDATQINYSNHKNHLLKDYMFAIVHMISGDI